jgi:hypothetical protein
MALNHPALPESALREPSDWVPEKQVITETFPVFPAHAIALPDGQTPWYPFGFMVNRACRYVAQSRQRIIGGARRPKPVPATPEPLEETHTYIDMMLLLSAFGPRKETSAHRSVESLLDEYPTNDGTDLLRRALQAITTVNCQQCGSSFDVREPHSCAPCDVEKVARATGVIDDMLQDISRTFAAK